MYVQVWTWTLVQYWSKMDLNSFRPKAAAIFIFVSHPREGRFLANFQEKTNKISAHKYSFILPTDPKNFIKVRWNTNFFFLRPKDLISTIYFGLTNNFIQLRNYVHVLGKKYNKCSRSVHFICTSLTMDPKNLWSSYFKPTCFTLPILLPCFSSQLPMS